MRQIMLIDITPDLARALERADGLEPMQGVRLGESAALVAEVVPQTLAHQQRTGADPRWGGFLAVDAESREVVGTCAYKGGPSPDGEVEIAYFTFPPHESRGVATAMADALTQRAARAGVATLVAHTLPEENASTRVLRRLGYHRAGERVDPDDGPVWRWERRVSEAPSRNA